MTNNEVSPLLSICIPTYNRAELLRSALLSVVPQLAEFKGEVELVVSDNCSTDNTQQVVEWARQLGPVRYHCNAENIGAARNVLRVANELARGEFCWILGDDDFIREGGITRVLQAIKSHPEIDYVFVSLCHIHIDQLSEFPSPIASWHLPDDLPRDNRIGEDHYVERWENLIEPDISGVFLGGVQVSVFRTSLWRQASKNMEVGETFSSFESTYPHITVLARCMVGKKAFYIGEPLVVVVDGAREWWDLVPMIILVRLNEALDLYEQVGVPKEQIERCRKFQMSRSGTAVIKMLVNPKMPGRQYVSLRKFFARYWYYKALWMSLWVAVVKSVLPRKILDSLKGLMAKSKKGSAA